MLRAPVIEQSRLSATYSSSERRTLIVCDRGFWTVMVGFDPRPEHCRPGLSSD